jgi:hypothetical protein
VTIRLASDGPQTLHADTIGAAWLAVAGRILADGIVSRYDGLRVREISLVMLAVDRPDPGDEIIASHAEPERLAWMHANFTDHAKVDALGGADSYATRLFDYEHSGRDQVAWVVDRLRRDPATRSAAITTFQPHTDASYIPCVSLLDFWLPNGAVELIAYAHSIDFGAKGHANLVELASLQQHVAGQLDRPAGRLLMMVKSAHVYETERADLLGVLAGSLLQRGQLAAASGLGQAPGLLQVQAPGLRRDPEDGRAAHQVVRPDRDPRGTRAQALDADLRVAAHHREAADVQLDGVGDVDVRAAHQGEHVEGELAALDLGLAQVDLVAAHDRDGVDAADRAEPAVPVRAAHDGDHPAHRLPGPDGRRAGPALLARLLRQIASQRREFAARLRDQRPAGSFLELIEGEPADGGMVAEYPQRGVALGVRDPKGIIRFAHYRSLAELAYRSARVRPALAVIQAGNAAAAGCWLPPGPRTSSSRRRR